MALKVTFISNYLTIHQISLCKEFYSRKDIDFVFVSSFGPSSEKSKYANFEKEPYVVRPYENDLRKKEALNVIDKSDIIIFGSGDISLIKKSKKKIIFFYSEHPSKKKITFLRKVHLNMIYRKFKNSYLLCASSYSKQDFNSVGLFKERCFYYGYFPYLFDLKESKNNDVVSLLWAGRELNWKHPEYAFYAAETLYKNSINFNLSIVSTSNSLIKELKLFYSNQPWFKYITFLEPVDNKSLQEMMARSNIFIFSSDHEEGWGAVVNEAMHSKCCVMASSLAGCTDYLIKDKINGVIFSNKEEFQKKLLLVVNEKKYFDLGRKAKDTIDLIWNEKNAVDNLIDVFKCVISCRKLPTNLINNGPGTKIL